MNLVPLFDKNFMDKEEKKKERKVKQLESQKKQNLSDAKQIKYRNPSNPRARKTNFVIERMSNSESSDKNKQISKNKRAEMLK